MREDAKIWRLHAFFLGRPFAVGISLGNVSRIEIPTKVLNCQGTDLGRATRFWYDLGYSIVQYIALVKCFVQYFALIFYFWRKSMNHPIYERLTTLCKEKGTSITALCEKVKGSKGNLVTWKKGKIDAVDLAMIKDLLNISVDDILVDKPTCPIRQEGNTKNFYEQLDKVCKEHNTTIYAVEKATGSSKGSFIKWKNSSPSADKLIEIADHFCISVDYLLGRETVAEENVIHADKVNFDISTNYGADYLEKIYKELDEKQKMFVLSWIIGYAQSQGITINF